ncbi:MAG: hypothetical protein HGB35_04140 [Geobacteraceae bacterium]|nr:hypothetical protein [Geobacteraceae bacterium]
MKLTKLLLLVVAFIMVARFGYAAETEAAKVNEEGQSDQRKMAGGFAREQALGGTESVNGVYDFNPFLKNDAYMLVNPAYVNIYKNYVWGNFDDTQSGPYSRTFAGANFAIDAVDGLTLGLLVNTKDAEAVTYSNLIDAGFRSAISGVSGASHSNFPIINNTLSFLAGYQINPNLGVGVQVYLGSASNKTETPFSPTATMTMESKISVFGVDLGGVYDNNSGLKVDLAGKLRFNSASDKAEITNLVNSETKLDGGTEIEINGRAFIELSQKVDLVPVAQFYHLNWKPSISPSATDPVNRPYQGYESTWNAFAIGAGLNVNLNKALIVGGVRFAQYTDEVKITNVSRTPGVDATNKYTTTALPIINLGVEYYALDWLTLRLGYGKAIYNYEQKVENSSASSSATTTITSRGNVYGNADNGDNVTAGVGFHFGSFNMDVALSNTFLTSGPYILSGNDGWDSGNGKLFALFSANYSW